MKQQLLYIINTTMENVHGNLFTDPAKQFIEESLHGQQNLSDMLQGEKMYRFFEDIRSTKHDVPCIVIVLVHSKTQKNKKMCAAV